MVQCFQAETQNSWIYNVKLIGSEKILNLNYTHQRPEPSRNRKHEKTKNKILNRYRNTYLKSSKPERKLERMFF